MDEFEQKVGILGGTFDPIHNGHLLVAEYAAYEFDLEEVLFIPAGDPPHKQGQEITNTDDRYLMTLLATIHNPKFSVSRLEIEKKGLSYTLDTVRELKSSQPKTKFYFITGADSILEISTWKQPQKLLSEIEFIAASRPGYSLSEMDEELYNDYKDQIHPLEVPRLDISSTEIRRRVRRGEPIKYQLPEEVEIYIKKHGLYQEEGLK
jgi:nicotinate-nucleotide adenylyltransferase